jgi:hypothetical protein
MDHIYIFVKLNSDWHYVIMIVWMKIKQALKRKVFDALQTYMLCVLVANEHEFETIIIILFYNQDDLNLRL